MPTFILPTLQFNEVTVPDGKGWDDAVSVLETYHPYRRYNGPGISVHTREEIQVLTRAQIEILERKDDDQGIDNRQMSEMQQTDDPHS